MNEITTPKPVLAESVPWHPIDCLPEDRKDGRDVLLWLGGDHAEICSWDGAWFDAVGREVAGATHWADTTGPGGETCLGR